MIESQNISTPSEHRNFVEKVVHRWEPASPTRPTLIVADLKSKQILQDLGLRHWGQYQNQDVLRAREFWQLLLQRLEPEISIVHPQFLQAQIEALLETLPEKLPRQSSATILKMIGEFSPVLFHEADGQNLLTWLQENSVSQNRWGLWYKLALHFANFFYLQQKLIAPDWIPAILRKNLEDGKIRDLRLFWNRPLIFDLGPELSATESEIIKILGEQVTCEILIPTPIWDAKRVWLEAYRAFALDPKSRPESRAPSSHRRSKRKWPTPLAECEAAVAQIRQWADQGHDLKKMAIYAPRIESYWPALEALLRFEGIPFQKAHKVRLAELPNFQLWLQKLQWRSGEVEGSGIELIRYSETEEELASLPARSEKLQAMTKQLLSLEDLGMDAKETVKDPKISRRDFTELAFRDAPPESSLQLMQNFLLTSTEATLHFSQWLKFLIATLHAIEVEVSPGFADGIHLLNIGEADDIPLGHRIFLGLTQSQVSPKGSMIVDNRDLARLRQDRGYDLKDQEISDRLFDLKWLAEDEVTEDVFFCADLNWNGDVEAASDFWLALEAPNRADFEPSRWQAEFESSPPQGNLLSATPNLSEPIVTDALVRIPVQPASAPGARGGKSSPIRLSAHSLKRILNCRFIYFAEREMGLLDPAERDIELSKMEQGQWLHRYVEEILRDPRGLVLGESELLALVQRVGLPPPGPLQSAILQKHLGILKKFQLFEGNWRDENPDVRPLLLEKNFEFEFEGLMINGKIDRVDQVGSPSENRVQLIDYKLTLASAPRQSSWLRDNELQMALYAWIIEKGGIPELGPKTVQAAYHISLRDGQRGHGFRDESLELPEGMESMPPLNEEKKAALFLNLETKIREAKRILEDGQFSPNPVDFELCETCRWRGLCRAPHLK